MKRGLLFWIVLSAILPFTVRPQDLPQTETSGPATRREMRQIRYTRQLDSMVNTLRFQFIPVNMEWGPNGSVEYINNYYYYVALYGNYLQVHIPVVIGRAISYNAIANIQTDTLSKVGTVRSGPGWKISFGAKDRNGTPYTFVLTVDSLSGRTVLDLVTTTNIMQYNGSLVANKELPAYTDPAPIGNRNSTESSSPAVPFDP